MPLTTIKGTNMGAIITNTQLGTSGTASSANVLPGTFAWTGATRSGLTNFAASDPASPNAGDVWYIAGQVKIALNTLPLGIGAWSSAAPTTLARRYAASCGTQTAHLAMGGLASPGISNITEEYNGTFWQSASNHLTTIRHFTACGTQSAALSISGEQASSNSVVCHEYDGTSWTVGGSISSARTSAGSAGTQTAGLTWCGIGGTGSNLCQEYDGSSWSAGGNYIVSSYDSQGGGTQTAAFGVGGMVSSSTVNNTGEYDGTTWSAGGNSNYAISEHSGGGIQTAGLRASGYTSSPSAATNTSEEYNGSTWTTSNNLSTTRRTANTGAGSMGLGLCCNGYISNFSSVSEEYTKPQIQYYNV
tara:strand:+ start:79 stop:1158 length:1080 start_codon:yes stop_codon:yes gene_type:complete